VYGKTQKKVVDLAVSIPVYVPMLIVGFSKRLHGVTFDGASWPMFVNTWTDRT
jgi:hypothetical protein